MVKKLSLGWLLCSLFVMASAITESELLKFQTTTKTLYFKDKYDDSYIKGYWPSKIDKLSSYLKPSSSKDTHTKKKASIADKYSSELKLKDNYINENYLKKLQELHKEK